MIAQAIGRTDRYQRITTKLSGENLDPLSCLPPPSMIERGNNGVACVR